MMIRVVSGVVMAAGIFGVLVYTPWWGMGLVVVLAMLAATWELLRMSRPGHPRYDLVVLSAAALVPVLWPALRSYVPSLTHGTALLAGFIILAFGRLFRPDPIDTSMDRLGRDAFSFLYVGVTFPYVFELRQLPAEGWVVLLAMAVVFLNDTGAYFAGRTFGRHKLYEKISPKKTMEGAAGGILAGVGAAFLARAYFPGLDVLEPVDAVVIGAGGAIFGMLGDLVESMMKRAYKVKDSSNLIPGHGGVLDRIDGLLVGGPFIYMYLVTFVWPHHAPW